MRFGDGYCCGNTCDIVRRRGGVDLERVRAGRDPHAHARREGLAPGEAAHGRAAIGVVAHRLLLGCYRRNKTKKERRRDDATGPDNTHGAGGGGWFEERFALRRTNCCSASRVWFFERGRAACKERLSCCY